MAARLKGIRVHLSDDVAVGRAVDAILRSISTISTLLELQAKQRLLRFGEVAAMLDCVGVAGAESSISREVAHTCAAIGARRDNLDLFTQEGGSPLPLHLPLHYRYMHAGGRLTSTTDYILTSEARDLHHILHALTASITCGYRLVAATRRQASTSITYHIR